MVRCRLGRSANPGTGAIAVAVPPGARKRPLCTHARSSDGGSPRTMANRATILPAARLHGAVPAPRVTPNVARQQRVSQSSIPKRLARTDISAQPHSRVRTNTGIQRSLGHNGTRRRDGLRVNDWMVMAWERLRRRSTRSIGRQWRPIARATASPLCPVPLDPVRLGGGPCDRLGADSCHDAPIVLFPARYAGPVRYF